MSNVTPIALRAAKVCLHSSPWPKPLTVIRLLNNLVHPTTSTKSINRPSRISQHIQPSDRSHFSSTSTISFRSTSVAQKLAAYSGSKEQGLTFRDGNLSQDELNDIFGAVVPPSQFSNRLLKVLHGRRVDGTLDIDLPIDLQPNLRKYPYATESALYWLRQNYPVDEDAAIIERIEREEARGEYENPSELTQRGQNIGLYGAQSAITGGTRRSQMDDSDSYGPQSGKYHAKLSEKEGDVFGRSAIDKIRAKNEAESEEEEKQLQIQIDRITEEATVKAKEKSEAIALRPDQGVELASDQIRPPNEFEKWILRARNRANSNLTLESPEIQNMTTTGRLLPSLVFVALCCVGCYLYSQYWIAPRRTERLWPEMSLSFSTMAGIIAVNTVVFCAWRFPPALRLLNLYFCVTPAYPRFASMLGNLFSHHNTRHYLMNMAALLVFGPGLHEEVGRGTFMAIYLSSGLVGSFASLAYYVTRGMMLTTSMGASGCIWGITAAYLCIHSEHTFTLFFIPEAWKETLQLKGWLFLAILVGVDVMSARAAKNIDTVAHWGGTAVGLATASWWKYNQRSQSLGGQHEVVPKKNLMLVQEEKTTRNR